MEPVPEQPDGVRKAILRHGVSRRSGSRESTPGGIRSRHSSGSSRGSRLSRRISRAFSLRRGAEVLPVRDLILLDSISEENVVTVLKKRFQDDQIYVRTRPPRFFSSRASSRLTLAASSCQSIRTRISASTTITKSLAIEVKKSSTTPAFSFHNLST